MHKKLSEMPKEWPLARKGRSYILVASHDDNKCIPILFALREMLGVARTKKEAKKICLDLGVKVNHRPRREIDFPILPRDILTLEKTKKNYILERKNKKFHLKEIKDQDGKTKIVKVIGKTQIAPGKFQANFEDGRNLVLKENFSCGDSVLIDLEKNKEIKIIPLKIGSKIEVVGGKHIGEQGKILEIKKEGKGIAYLINITGGKEVLLDKKALMAIE